jgi:Radical SAM superfamily/B12 binding domain
MSKVLLTHLNHEYNFCLPLELLRAYARTSKAIRDGVSFTVRPFSFAREYYVNSQGIEVYANTAGAIAAEQPDVVAYSTYIWNMLATLSVGRAVKKMLPRTLTVLGGGEFLTRAASLRVMREQPWVDVVVVGEGEFTFQELLLRYLDGGTRALGDVPGLVFRDGGEVVATAARTPIQDLDVIPSPFLGADPATLAGPVLIETYRGCPFKCSFCTFPKALSGLRRYSAGRVVDDLRRIQSVNPQAVVWFVDAVFNLPLDRTREILRFLADSQFPYSAEFQAELLSAEMVDLFARTNIQHYDFGLQSTSEDVLANVDRTSFKPAKFAANVRMVMENPANKGRSVNLQAIFGLPGETYDTFKDTVDYALRQSPKILNLFRLCLLPGSKLFEEIDQRGIACLPEAPYEIIRSDAMSIEDVRRADRLRRGVQLLYNTGMARNVLLFLDHLGDYPPSLVCEIFYDYIEGVMGEARSNLFSPLGVAAATVAEFIEAVRVFFAALLSHVSLPPRVLALIHDALELNAKRVELAFLRPGRVAPAFEPGRHTGSLARARLELSPYVRLHEALFDVHEQHNIYRLIDGLDALEPERRHYVLAASGGSVSLHLAPEELFHALAAFEGGPIEVREAHERAREAGVLLDLEAFVDLVREVPLGVLLAPGAGASAEPTLDALAVGRAARAALEGLRPRPRRDLAAAAETLVECGEGTSRQRIPLRVI